MKHDMTQTPWPCLLGITICALFILGVAGQAQAQATSPLIGPLVGHADAHSAILWARLPETGVYQVSLTPDNGDPGESTTVSAEATADADFTARWRFADLQ